MVLYEGIIKPDYANCLDKDFGPDYCPDKPDPTKPDPTKPDPTITHFTTTTVMPTKPDPTKPDPTKPDPTKPDPTITLPTIDPTRPDPTKPDPTKPDPTKPDPTITLPTIDPTITLPTIEPTKPPKKCTDSDATYGIKEHKTGKGGCPPTPINYSLVNAESIPNSIPLDAHASHGTHIDARSYVNAGVGFEKTFQHRDAFVSRFNLCDGKF